MSDDANLRELGTATDPSSFLGFALTDRDGRINRAALPACLDPAFASLKSPWRSILWPVKPAGQWPTTRLLDNHDFRHPHYFGAKQTLEARDVGLRSTKAPVDAKTPSREFFPFQVAGRRSIEVALDGSTLTHDAYAMWTGLNGESPNDYQMRRLPETDLLFYKKACGALAFQTDVPNEPGVFHTRVILATITFFQGPPSDYSLMLRYINYTHRDPRLILNLPYLTGQDSTDRALQWAYEEALLGFNDACQREGWDTTHTESMAGLTAAVDAADQTAFNEQVTGRPWEEALRRVEQPWQFVLAVTLCDLGPIARRPTPYKRAKAMMETLRRQDATEAARLELLWEASIPALQALTAEEQ